MQQVPGHLQNYPYPGISAPSRSHNLFVNPSVNYNPYYYLQKPLPPKPFRPSQQVPNGAYYKATAPPVVQHRPHSPNEKSKEEEREEKGKQEQERPSEKEDTREQGEVDEEEEEEEQRQPKYTNRKPNSVEEQSEEEYEEEEDRKPQTSGR